MTSEWMLGSVGKALCKGLRMQEMEEVAESGGDAGSARDAKGA